MYFIPDLLQADDKLEKCTNFGKLSLGNFHSKNAVCTQEAVIFRLKCPDNIKSTENTSPELIRYLRKFFQATKSGGCYGSISVKMKMYFKCLVHCCYPYVLLGSSRGMDLNFKGLKLIPDSVVTQFSLKNSNR